MSVNDENPGSSDPPNRGNFPEAFSESSSDFTPDLPSDLIGLAPPAAAVATPVPEPEEEAFLDPPESTFEPELPWQRADSLGQLTAETPAPSTSNSFDTSEDLELLRPPAAAMVDTETEHSTEPPPGQVQSHGHLSTNIPEKAAPPPPEQLDPERYAGRNVANWIKNDDSVAIISYYQLLPHSAEKRKAIEWAVNHAKSDSMEPLLHICRMELDPHMRAHLAKVVDAIPPDTLLPKLENRDYSSELRMGLPFFLSRCKLHNAIPRMQELSNDQEAQIRENVVDAVVHMPYLEEFHLSLLKSRLAYDRNRSVRLAAARALLLLRRPAAKDALAEALAVNPPTKEISALLTSTMGERRREIDRRLTVDRRVSETTFDGEEKRETPDRRKADERREMSLEEAVAAMADGPEKVAAPNNRQRDMILLAGGIVLVIILIIYLVSHFVKASREVPETTSPPAATSR